MSRVKTSETARGYHHGDLRNALIAAAAELAAEGGPDAVTIRGAARIVGVTPTAAYRHFANQADLLAATKERAMSGMLAAMAEHLAQLPESGDAAATAIDRLTSVGRGYIQYALAEPGVFRTAFTGRLHADSAPTDGPSWPDPQLTEVAPYRLLGEMLDALVETGYLSPDDRPGAEAGPWAAVHGLAMLMLDGPLRLAPPAEREAAIEQTLRLVARGLATGGAA